MDCCGCTASSRVLEYGETEPESLRGRNSVVLFDLDYYLPHRYINLLFCLYALINNFPAFALSLILAFIFPVEVQKEFVASHTKGEARSLCEEYIMNLELNHGSQVIDGNPVNDWYLEVSEKKSRAEESSL